MTAVAVLERQTLVLNKNWTAVQIASVKDAIGLVAKGAALIIDPETVQTHNLDSWDAVSRSRTKLGDAVIRSARLSILPPEVIVLTQYDKLAKRSVVFSRRNLFKRDKFTCMFCGAQPGPEELTIDHVTPKSRGGTSSWENCVLACVECNKRKADRLLGECGMKLRKAPKKPSWKVLAHIAPRDRRESWEKFVDRAYWNIELEP